jgi:PAS domain S-box-containing protein
MARTKRKTNRADELRRKAEARIAARLDRIESAPAEDIPRLLHELRIHQVELEVQNETLRIAQEELEESRSKYAYLYDFAPVAYLTLNKHGLIEEANQTARGLLAVVGNDVKTRRLSWFVAPQDRAVLDQHMIQALETSVKQTCQLRLEKRGGRTRYVQMESLLVEGGNNGREKVFAALFDITPQKTLEMRLKEAEKSYRTLAENSPDVIARFDRDLRYVYVNPAVELHARIPHERFAGRTNGEVGIPPQLTGMWEAGIQRVFKTGVRGKVEFDYPAPGVSTSFQAWAIPEFNDAGGVETVLTIVRDITDLKHEQAKLRAILENAPVAIVVVDHACRFTMANQLAKETYGRPVPFGEPVETHATLGICYPDGNPCDPLDLPLCRSVFQGEVHENLELGILWPDSQKRAMIVNTAPIKDPSGKIIGAVGAFKDITELVEQREGLRHARDELEVRVRERTADLFQAKRILETEVRERRRAEAVLKAHEEELENLNKQLKLEIEKRKQFEKSLKSSTEKIIQEHNLRKALSKQLVDLLEKDRREMAMALHDHAGQILTTLKMDLEAIENHVNQGPALPRLKTAKDKSLELLAFIKDTSAQLRPTMLDTLGLVSAVRNLIDQFQSTTEAKISLHTGNIPKSLGHTVEIALYRIIQESLTNGLKHAYAKNLYVNLIRKGRENAVLLSIEDDGRGFDQGGELDYVPEAGHFGVTIMRERAVLLGGDFRIESSPGKGTVVMVEIPFG